MTSQNSAAATEGLEAPEARRSGGVLGLEERLGAVQGAREALVDGQLAVRAVEEGPDLAKLGSEDRDIDCTLGDWEALRARHV